MQPPRRRPTDHPSGPLRPLRSQFRLRPLRSSPPALSLNGLLALLAIASILVAACGGATGPSQSPVGFQGTTWRATSIRDVAPLAGAEPTVRFDGNQAAGTTGCNTYGGTFTLGADGSFGLDSMVMTEMACDGARGTQEAAVVEILSAAGRLELVDGELKISGPSGSITFAEDPR